MNLENCKKKMLANSFLRSILTNFQLRLKLSGELCQNTSVKGVVKLLFLHFDAGEQCTLKN